MHSIIVLLLTSGVAALFFPRTCAAEVGQRTLRLFEERRQRPIVVEVWYPTTDVPSGSDRSRFSSFVRSPTVRDGALMGGRRALILVSHGTGGGRLALEWLTAGLARKGHVVAAVDHWGNTYDNAVPEYFLRPWERPQDLSFALTELLRQPDFGPCIDHERIGAIGFSLGGYTVLALAGAMMDIDTLYRYAGTAEGRLENAIPEFPALPEFMQEPGTKERVYASFGSAPPLQDLRIKAAVALAPAIGQAFTKAAQFSKLRAPILIVGAEADRVAPMRTNASHYHALIAGSRQVVLRGEVGHYVFLNEGGEELKAERPEFFVDHPSCDRRAIHQKVIGLAADFFAEHLASCDIPSTAQ